MSSSGACVGTSNTPGLSDPSSTEGCASASATPALSAVAAAPEPPPDPTPSPFTPPVASEAASVPSPALSAVSRALRARSSASAAGRAPGAAASEAPKPDGSLLVASVAGAKLDVGNDESRRWRAPGLSGGGVVMSTAFARSKAARTRGSVHSCISRLPATSRADDPWLPMVVGGGRRAPQWRLARTWRTMCPTTRVLSPARQSFGKPRRMATPPRGWRRVRVPAAWKYGQQLVLPQVERRQALPQRGAVYPPGHDGDLHARVCAAEATCR